MAPCANPFVPTTSPNAVPTISLRMRHSNVELSNGFKHGASSAHGRSEPYWRTFGQPNRRDNSLSRVGPSLNFELLWDFARLREFVLWHNVPTSWSQPHRQIRSRRIHWRCAGPSYLQNVSLQSCKTRMRLCKTMFPVYIAADQFQSFGRSDVPPRRRDKLLRE